MKKDYTWRRIVIGYRHRQLIWYIFGIMKGKQENKHSLEGQKRLGWIVQGYILHMETEERGCGREQKKASLR